MKELKGHGKIATKTGKEKKKKSRILAKRSKGGAKGRNIREPGQT